MWCDIHQGVNIGSNLSKTGKPLTPKIGNNVWIGPGAKIFGEIIIGDNVVIATNSVVNSNIKDSITVAGIPAVKISDKSTRDLSISANKNHTDIFFKSYHNIINIEININLYSLNSLHN